MTAGVPKADAKASASPPAESRGAAAIPSLAVPDSQPPPPPPALAHRTEELKEYFKTPQGRDMKKPSFSVLPIGEPHLECPQ